jgi:hypothetical protein
MALALTILGGVVAAAIAAVLAHRLTSRRDQANRRSDLRVEYLVGAYRAIADTAHRDLNPSAEHVRAFEQGLADIQLLGSKVQAEMAIAVGKQLASTGGADLDTLLLSLRDELRTELELETIPIAPFTVRVMDKDRR